MGEFELIQRYFTNMSQDENVILGIGDDAAILQSPDKPLLVSVDTLISGVHFPEHTPAADMARKALAVNVSDIAAMGGTPRWFTLALTLPDSRDAQWLEAFADGLAETARQYNVVLVGGDTTRGSLSITINIIGEAETEPLRRAGAGAGDRIYVTGTLGNAAAALPYALKSSSDHLDTTVQKTDSASIEIDQHADFPEDKQAAIEACLTRLNRPQARTDASPLIARFASACIDVSDGLLQDLSHILKASSLNARISPTALPISAALQALHDVEMQQALALSGGDDYELLFTVPQDYCAELEQAMQTAGVKITAIGELTAPIPTSGHPELVSGQISDSQGQPLSIKGFQHF